MAYADHLYVTRLGYTHHGIDCGDETVIHYNGGLWNPEFAKVERASLEEFSRGEPVATLSYGQCDDPEIVMARAQSRLGEEAYDLFENNCEHFARWCKTGRAKSEQIENTVSLVTGLTKEASILATALKMIRYSEIAEESTLARAGIVSSVPAVGVAALGTLSALVSQKVMDQILKDDQTLPEEERKARLMGRMMTNMGAVTGTLGTLGIISASGSVAGLSAAGVETGLIALGSVVGGELIAGTVLSVTAPAVIATAIGYGSYRLWKKWKMK